MATTDSTKVLDPQVLGDMVSASLTAGMKFRPLLQDDTTLVDRAGSTVEFPAFNYIGDAVDLDENTAIDPNALSYGTKQATVKEIGQGVSITNNALAIGYGDPIGEAGKQLQTAIDNKIDNDIHSVLANAVLSASVPVSVEGLQTALDSFNYEGDVNSLVLVASPQAAGKLRIEAGKDFVSASQLGANIVSGAYGEILGVTIIRSRKLNHNEAYLVDTSVDDGKPAIKLMRKKDATIETEYKPGERKTNIYATALVAPYLYNDQKVVKVTFDGLDATGATTGAPKNQAVATEPTNVEGSKRIGRQKKTTSGSPSATLGH